VTRDAETQRNIEALRPVYEAWARGDDWRAGFDVYGDEMTWGWSEEFPDIHGTYGDPDEAAALMGQWLSQWENWRCEAEQYVPVADRVVVLTRYRGTGRGSRVEVDTKGAHVWTMRDGRAAALMVFSDRDKALAAAGLGSAEGKEPR
jgi:ketosteroid isomerase-like protein